MGRKYYTFTAYAWTLDPDYDASYQTSQRATFPSTAQCELITSKAQDCLSLYYHLHWPIHSLIISLHLLSLSLKRAHISLVTVVHVHGANISFREENLMTFPRSIYCSIAPTLASQSRNFPPILPCRDWWHPPTAFITARGCIHRPNTYPPTPPEHFPALLVSVLRTVNNPARKTS